MAPAPDPQAIRLSIARETASYLTTALRSTAVASTLAPLLCLPLFYEDVTPWRLLLWLACSLLGLGIRIGLTLGLPTDVAKIEAPDVHIRRVTWCVALTGLGWGMGWGLLIPELGLVNRLIYLYIATGAMFSGMFGYGVHRPAFLAFAVPIFLPALVVAFWPGHGFPWPFSLGLATLVISVYGISKRFARTYRDSLQLRLRNESLYQDLAAERDASITANLAKSRFIASASHDLRQPMHAVNFYLESLDLRDIPEPQRTVIAKVHRSVTNLNQMFESLLDVSKLDAFTLQPVNEPFKLGDLMRAVEEVGAPLAAEQGIGFTVLGPDGWMLGDEKLLRQVLLNLVTNAVYYTPEGRVEVVFGQEDGRLCIEVRDTGCGIPPEDLDLIFTEFYRVSETRTRHDGLGLGLSIVKRLCDLTGAQVQVRSQVGIGSVFRVLTSCTMADSGSQPAARALPVAGAPVSLVGLSVGLVEDDANIVEAYRQALAQRGARVVALSEDPQQLQQQLLELDDLDLIISDFRLQSTTGDLVIQQLRENYNRDIPAIIVTADTSPAHITFFSALNVPVLHKPVSFQQLLETVEQVLRSESAPAD